MISAPRCTSACFSDSNCARRMDHRDVTAELPFERRDLERVNVE